MKIKITKRFLLSLCLMTLTLLCGENKAWGQSVINFTTTLNAETVMTTKTWTVDDVSIVFSKGTNSNAPKYYKATKNTVAAVRMYENNTMTISVPESSTIKSIVFSLGTTKTAPVTPSTGSLSGDKTTWTSPSDGNTNSVSFSIGTGQFHITSISITYETTPAPIFSLVKGTYNGPQHVTITAPDKYTGGIVYTIDGSDPTTSGTAKDYSDAGIDINTTTTLRAVAYDSDINFSGEATAKYTITYNAPTFSLPGGTYYGNQSVSISVADLGSGSILYTTDGTDPKTNGTKYTEAISLPVGTKPTLKAVAKYGEGLFSEVTEATYDIQKASSTFFQRITSAAELTANETYLIVCESKSKAFGKISNKKGTPQTVKITGNKIDLSADGTGTPTEFILEKSNESGYLLKNPTTGKYIVLVDDTNVTETETGTALNISFKTDGSAKIYKSGTTRQILYRASSYNVFGNYGNDNVSASGYNKVYLYKKHVIKEFSDTEDLATSLPTSPLADQTITLNRNLYSGWNTFCVPFALTQEQLEEAYGSGAVAKYLSGVTTDGAAVTLHFAPENGGGIEANKAYLLYLTADVKEAKTFSGVTLEPAGTCTTTVKADNGGDYTFQGILKPTTLETDDTQYFLNSLGTNFVLPSNSTNAMKATRAYIIVPAPAAPAQGRQYTFDFNGTTTGIDNVNISGLEDGSAWYTISGIRVNRPAAKGVYIHNGRKVIVK